MKPILSVTLIALAAIVAILSWYGLFAPTTLSEQTIPSFSFAYKKQTGNYRQSGRAMNDMYWKLDKEGISTTQGVGLYYDNPKKVAVQNLRSLAGCILPDESAEKWEELRTDYLIGTLPGATLPVITFPYKGKLSVVLGTLKVYPKLDAWFKAHPDQKGPVMEIYDMSKGEIRYVVARPMGGEVLDALWRAERP
ncbi:GyrI-like domain-containing protein [Desulfoluna butyratoxydans]|uniref:Gyri-like small molecule binding domain n=1 Tax=Desulfoluna butyratoxydans TaxID=231438 RepID=A0A4U8YKB4_9BACT|nr:GyrI-like domain-containing protein [Desulfoluna butyratoxydans]VFQ43887.1 gyri-like small molecule binding domain [Desulfoluna butyratoxydans]